MGPSCKEDDVADAQLMRSSLSQSDSIAVNSAASCSCRGVKLKRFPKKPRADVNTFAIGLSSSETVGNMVNARLTMADSSSRDPIGRPVWSSVLTSAVCCAVAGCIG